MFSQRGFVAPPTDAELRAADAMRRRIERGDDGEDDGMKVRLLPIRPRSRGARRSLRTFPVVTLHPRFPFNVRLTGKTFD